MRTFQFAISREPKGGLKAITDERVGRDVKASTANGLLKIDIEGERAAECVRNEEAIRRIASRLAPKWVAAVSIINEDGLHVGALALQ